MLDSIEELEREIELFKTNIQGSNELIGILEKTLSELTENNKKIDSAVEKGSESVRSLPKKIEEQNKEDQQELLAKIYSDFENVRAGLDSDCERLCSELREVQNKASEMIQQESNDACGRIKETSEQISELQNDLVKIKEELNSIKQQFSADVINATENSFRRFETEIQEALSAQQKDIDETIAGINAKTSHLNDIIEEQQDSISQLQGQIGNVSQQYLQTRQMIEMLSVQNSKLAKKQTVWSLVISLLIIIGIIMGLIF